MKFWSVPMRTRAVAVGLGQAGRLDRDRSRACGPPGPSSRRRPGRAASAGWTPTWSPRKRVGQLAPGRLEGELGALVQGGPEPLGAELLGQVAHAGQAAVLPVAQLAEDLGHAPAELDRLVGPDEDVDVRRHPLAVGQPAADEHVEPDGPVAVLGRPQADVVDLDPGAVLQAAGHGDLELAGQVGVLAVAGEVGGDGLGHREGLDHLAGIDARHRARAHVAGGVAAGLDGGQAHVPEALPDAGDVGDADPVQLDVLAGREVGVAVAEDRAVVGSLGEGVGRHADLADLRRGHHPAGHLDPHHEGVAALASAGTCPTHLSRSCSPGTALMESAPCLE